MSRPAGTWLAVGRIRRPHGIHGEVVVEITTDFPDRIKPGLEIRIGDSAPERTLTIHRVRVHKGAWLMSFVGPTTRDEVEPLRELWVFLPAQARKDLPKDYYYEHELIGCTCILEDGSPVGEVVELADAGGGPMLGVRVGERDVMVPFRSPIVVRVDLDAHAIMLDPPRGLLDDDAL